MATTTNSVMANLGELFEMEAERREELAARAARAQAEQQAEREAELRRAEMERAAARAAERAAAQLAVAREAAAAEARLAQLRQELVEVRIERQQMRARAETVAALPAPRRPRGWLTGALAAASLALGLTATVVSWPQPVATSPVATSPVATSPGAPAAHSAVPELAAPATPELQSAPPAPTAAPEPVAEASRSATPVRRPRIRRPRRPRPEPAQRELDRLDLGNDNTVLSDDFLNGAGH